MMHPAAVRLGGRALALAPRALEALFASAVALRGTQAASPLPSDRVPAPRSYAVTDSGIAVVPVIGPLVARADWLSALFGAMSYGDVGNAVETAAADPAARAILLELDSPGGEVGGLFDLADRLAALREASGKPLWTVASESALSAAYAIASAAEQIYVTRTAEIGSVGVVAVHIDESTADAMAGLKWTLIHAGAKKVDGNPHEPLSGSAFSDIQADVDALHAELVGMIANNRGMSPDAVRATEAAIYRGQRGVDVGFADRIGTVEQALADLATELDTNRTRALTPRRERVASPQPARSKSQMTTETTTESPSGDAPASQIEPTAEPGPAKAPAPAAPEATREPPAFAAPATATAPSAPDALRAEFAEIAALAAQAARLGVAVDAAEAMRKGVKPDALRRSVLDALAARAEASTLVAATPQPAAGDSPIIRRARARATAARGQQ